MIGKNEVIFDWHLPNSVYSLINWSTLSLREISVIRQDLNFTIWLGKEDYVCSSNRSNPVNEPDQFLPTVDRNHTHGEIFF